MSKTSARGAITITGARQNNLKNLDVTIRLNEFTVITGVSGSGKSSLAFDTLYAEGQRRYVETFSAYARQFLDRMDKPQVDHIDGIPPAIAIDQVNPVRTSRSTVGTMTELNDHIKLLFARAANLFCSGCAQPVRRETPQSICDQVVALARDDQRVVVTFDLAVPAEMGDAELSGWLAGQGYTRIHSRRSGFAEVVQDRLRLSAESRERFVEALDAALVYGHGRVSVHLTDAEGGVVASHKFSTALHCARCDIAYNDPVPSLFSFNSPLGACESCRGFGRVMGIDYRLVIPDDGKTLAGGAVKPWQTQSYSECQDDLLKFARKRGVPVDKPWRKLTKTQRRWVIEGEGHWDEGVWYGVQRFFDWLETKSYKMHIRVLLSKYRAYRVCTVCGGARLKPHALLWRIGSKRDADAALDGVGRARPVAVNWSDEALRALPGLNFHDVMLLPLERAREFFANLTLPPPFDEAADLLLREINTRFAYLVEVGLGYLTLDRQSRTLSGGEVQRINLTTALGTSLVNTLFVLDEPSIGLHARDVARVVAILRRIRDAGNTVVVVEHDPDVILAAERIIDMGPGAGAAGGEIVFSGTPAQLRRDKRSITAQYLAGRRRLTRPQRLTVDDQGPQLSVRGARQHNLKSIDVDIPLQRFVVLTGVSGSGKSTLVQDILYNALRQHWGRPLDEPGDHDAIVGAEHLDDVVLVNQNPIGKTTRSTPAVYVGAFDAIRQLFAVQPLAKERGYNASTFSFNSGNGRCPTCGGNGFEHVEMQFLSDVYLRCADCDGSRYRAEVLDVRFYSDAASGGKSVADVLAMTVDEAVAFFAGHHDVAAALRPLQGVGLGYLTLGQPVPTLSGGEAQRLKLAGFLSAKTRAEGKRVLFMFDEPTTGLHFEDVAKLLGAFDTLLANGHSLLVIEHHLELINAADWVIDLGPEGGTAGGNVVCTGTPESLLDHETSYTGAALRGMRQRKRLQPPSAPPSVRAMAPVYSGNGIEIRHAREHNLKNVDITIPREKFTVITGLSGSGKSTVAFDILFAEGQRRYLESLNAYARQFVQPAARPDVDAVYGIPPTVAIEQRTSRGGRKSTVATATEVYHYLRLLFVKLGTQYCPDCNVPIAPQSIDSIVAHVVKTHGGRMVDVLAPLVVARKGLYNELAQWASAKGFDKLWVDGEYRSTADWKKLDRYVEHDIDLPLASIKVAKNNEATLRRELSRALEWGKGTVRIQASPVSKKSAGHIGLFSTERACPSCHRSFAELDPRLFSYNSKHGWCPRCYGTGLEMRGFDSDQSGEESAWLEGAAAAAQPCRACHGKRLNSVALNVRFSGDTIAELTALTVDRAAARFGKLSLKGRARDLTRDILPELRARLGFLQEVGLGYLSLDRAAPTLSGGEAQRIRLAAQLGSNLRGVCYVLDEPTIGLHSRDNKLLLTTLHRLQQRGNTVVVVEHDEDTIRSADHIIDLGPGAGVDGGRLVAQGSVKQVMAAKESITGRFLAHPIAHPLAQRRATAVTSRSGDAIRLSGVSLHNLQRLNVAVPLNRLVCVTGVSGSGKSTLVRQVLRENLAHLVARRRGRAALQGCEAIDGWQAIRRVLEVDQTPIGKTPRSSPATYLGIWDDIRAVYAQTEEARVRGYKANRFSFNVGGGRCAACEGQGIKTIEMSFLPNVKVPCEVCNGARFNRETLDVLYKGKSIGDVLAMNVDAAVEFFHAHAKVRHALSLLRDVGLGYLTLGQQSPTLSGGEAQRLKLVTELAKVKPGVENKNAALYLLDEPTVGLHMGDVEKLIVVLQRLVDAGNSVVVIEHNLDVIAEADWIIDMGPEGGEKGGKVVAAGAPEKIAKAKTHTGRALAAFLSR